jgi:D-serine deaminase-like pyridoxal phosphate-dependent protein
MVLEREEQEQEMSEFQVRNENSSLPFRIEKPTLLLDRAKVLRNIEKMARKAQTSGVRFRPHFKTHQSAQIGEWFRDYGVESITVSSVDMAAYFANNGWKDITIAFPVNLLQLGKINELARENELGLLVESMEAVRFLERNLRFSAHAWIKIDTGYKRTGIWWDKFGEVVELAEAIERAPNLSFRGLLAHGGHSYKSIHLDTVSRLKEVQQSLQANGLPRAELSVGDTPTCSVVDDFSAVDEIRPGNFVFHDLKQRSIGSCSEEDIAVAVACPVVAKHKDRSEIILYGGAVHLAKDFLPREDGSKLFGRIALTEEQGWGPTIKDTYVSSLSQEHGIVKASDPLFSQVRVGDVLIVLPVHSCLTANLLKEYVTLDGETIEMAGIV